MLNSVLEKLSKLIFPNRCIVCGNLILNKYFCADCKDLLTPFSVKLCTKCGQPVKDCSCFANFFYFDKVTCVFPNDDVIKNCFYRFKFRHNIASAGFFGSEMARAAEKSFNIKEFDFITYIPMHPLKIIDRGYNQTAVLAKTLKKELHLPLKRVLYQPKVFNAQHSVSGIDERFLNIKGKYKVRKNADLKGKNILLVDDIMTTGATLSEVSRLLKLKDAESVACVTALRTIKREEKKG